MTKKRPVYEKITKILGRVLEQAKPYDYLFPYYADIRIASMTTDVFDVEDDGIFLKKKEGQISLFYEPKGQIPFIATPEQIEEIIERKGYVHEDYLPRLLEDISNNFAKGITNAEFNYREQTPFSQQRKELEARLREAVSPKKS